MLTFLRSTLFNFSFYILTGLACIALLPTLLLPRRFYMAVVHGFVHSTAFLEKYILGLNFEVRGAEHLPKDGSYIIASKHQSAYETYKLHILFNDPAVVLKRELLKIPFWGKYLGKSDPIAINRTSPKEAIKSLQTEGQRVAAQGRPIVIFPQGTRVSITTTAEEKPYKVGIIRLQEATKLPIIPLAMNSGYFYPKHKWKKKSGTVLFEFLEPVPYEEGQKANTALRRLEMQIEEKSSHLLEESKNTPPPKFSLEFKAALSFFILLCSIYSGYWYFTANLVHEGANKFITDLKNHPVVEEYRTGDIKLGGYPLKMHLQLFNQTVSSRAETINIKALELEGWPFPEMPIDIKAYDLSLSNHFWTGALALDSVDATIRMDGDILNVNTLDILSEELTFHATGEIDLKHEPYPNFHFDLEIEGIQEFLQTLVKYKVIPAKQAMIAGVSLSAMERGGVIKTTLSSKDNKVYFGLIKILDLPSPTKFSSTQ